MALISALVRNKVTKKENPYNGTFCMFCIEFLGICTVKYETSEWENYASEPTKKGMNLFLDMLFHEVRNK